LIFTILLAGGSGTRVTGYPMPKQFITIRNKPLLEWALIPFLTHRRIDQIVIVSHHDYVEQVRAITSKFTDKPIHIVGGGPTRQASVFQGLSLLKKHACDDDIVIIHDAARVLVDHPIINRGLDMMIGDIGLSAVIPAADTLMETGENNTLTRVIDRNRVSIIQTPQIFHFKTIYDAHLSNVGGSFTDDVSLLIGRIAIHHFLGSGLNFKVTTAADIRLLENLLTQEGAP